MLLIKVKRYKRSYWDRSWSDVKVLSFLLWLEMIQAFDGDLQMTHLLHPVSTAVEQLIAKFREWVCATRASRILTVGETGMPTKCHSPGWVGQVLTLDKYTASIAHEGTYSFQVVRTGKTLVKTLWRRYLGEIKRPGFLRIMEKCKDIREVEWHMPFREYGKLVWTIKGHRYAGCGDWCNYWLCFVLNFPTKVDIIWRSRPCLILKFFGTEFLKIRLDNKVMGMQGKNDGVAGRLMIPSEDSTT